MPIPARMAALALLPILVLGACAKAPLTRAPKVDQKQIEDGAPPNALVLWPAPRDFEARVAAAGVPALTAEHDDYHLHVHLEVWRGDAQIMVPPNIGVEVGGKRISPVHTHKPSGVIHVESPEIAAFTLGQFFTLWGVPLDGATAWVDDVQAPDAASVRFSDRQLITVRFGDPR